MPTTKSSNFELFFIAALRTVFSVAQATAHCVESQLLTSATRVASLCARDKNFTSISS